MESMMIPNPACLGLEALVPSGTVIHDQIQKMHEDLKASGQELVQQSSLFTRARELYQDTLISSAGYVVIMHSMDLKDPADLLNMYIATESAYDQSVEAYSRCVDRFVHFCQSHLDDPTYQTAYQQAIEDARKEQRNILSLDPRDHDVIRIPNFESIDIIQMSDASMEGFFRNIIGRFSHFLTKDSKCKEMYEEIVASAKSASNESDKKFRDIEHGFKCPIQTIMDQTIKKIPILMSWVLKASERVHQSKDQHLKDIQDMVKDESPLRTLAFEIDDLMEGKLFEGTDGKSTYGALGYNIKNVTFCMQNFLKVSGQRQAMKQVESMLGEYAYDDMMYRGGQEYEVLKWLVYSINICIQIYDKTDYILYRMGKDIKSCL